MQCALFVHLSSKSFSPQAIYDTFFAESPISNFNAYTEFHNQFPLVLRDLVPDSLIIAATIQKQHSTILLKALFDPGLDLMFLHQ
jgi:hypothetical protein